MAMVMAHEQTTQLSLRRIARELSGSGTRLAWRSSAPRPVNRDTTVRQERQQHVRRTHPGADKALLVPVVIAVGEAGAPRAGRQRHAAGVAHRHAIAPAMEGSHRRRQS